MPRNTAVSAVSRSATSRPAVATPPPVPDEGAADDMAGGAGWIG